MVPGSLCGLSLQGNMGRGLLGGLCTLTLPLASLGLQSSPLLGLDLDQAQAPLIPSFPSDHLWAFLREEKTTPRPLAGTFPYITLPQMSPVLESVGLPSR